jgi:chromosome segregation ATPase
MRMETQDLLERLDQVEARMRANTENLKQAMREQGAEMQEGFTENREAIQANQEAIRQLARAVDVLAASQAALGRTQQRQEARFQAWLEGLQARLNEHQDNTEESLHLVSGIVKTWLHRQAQDAELLRQDVRDHEARLQALEQDRPPAA